MYFKRSPNCANKRLLVIMKSLSIEDNIYYLRLLII
jgi:hypothetical protein